MLDSVLIYSITHPQNIKAQNSASAKNTDNHSDKKIFSESQNL